MLSLVLGNTSEHCKQIASSCKEKTAGMDTQTLGYDESMTNGSKPDKNHVTANHYCKTTDCSGRI